MVMLLLSTFLHLIKKKPIQVEFKPKEEEKWYVLRKMKHWAFWFQISLFGLEKVPLFSPQKVQKICVWRVTIYFEHFDVFAFWKFLESCDTEAVVSQAKLSQQCYFLPTTGWLVQIVKKLFQGYLRVCVCLLLLHNIVAESERLKKKDWMARVWLLVRML